MVKPNELHDHDAEAACLGACFFDADCWTEVGCLAAADFHRPDHAAIFAGMQSLHGRFDALQLAQALKRMGLLETAGGPGALMALDQSVPVVANVGAYVAAVRAMSLRRAAYHRALQLAEDACNLGRDVGESVLEASSHFARLGTNGVDHLLTGYDAVERLRVHLDKVQRGEVLPCIPTGIGAWDYCLGGLQPGTVTVLGGRPGLGKTQIATSIGLQLAHQWADKAPGASRTGWVWLEDPIEALTRRGVAHASGVPVWRIAKEVLTGQMLQDVGNGLVNLSDLVGDAWRIREASGLTDKQLDVTLRQMAVKHGCRVLIVDHMGEVEVDGTQFRHARDLMGRQVMKVCRNVAKDLNVAVLLLLHLTRSTNKDKEQRHQRPTLESGGETSAIEKMARAMVYLWDDPDHPGFVACYVPKQTEGEKGFDFHLRLHKSAALVYPSGGLVPEGVRGFTEPEGLTILPKPEAQA